MAALLFGLGRGLVAIADSLQMQGAVSSLGRAFDYYAAVGDVDRAAAAEELPEPPVAFLSEVPQLLSQALELVPANSHQAGRLLSRYGNVLGQQEGDHEAAQDAFARALAIARGEGDEALEMRTLANASRNDAFHLRWQESLDKCLRAIELARRLDEPQALVPASFWTAQSLVVGGDLEAAKDVATAALAAAERLRYRYWLADALDTNGLVTGCQGDWQTARRYFERGLAITPDLPRFAFQMSLLEYEIGDFDQSESYLKLVVDAQKWFEERPETGLVAVAIPLVARIGGEIAHFDVAESSSEMVLFAPSSTPLFTLMARVDSG